MSNGRFCDNCDASLHLNARGDDEYGEVAAWIVLQAADRDWDACSRSCATELLADGTELALAVDAQLEAIADIARVIREDREDGSGSCETPGETR